MQGNLMTVQLDDEIQQERLAELSAGRQPVVRVEVDDGRKRTMDQLKKIWALIHEISEWGGYPTGYTEDLMKSYVREIFELNPFSLSDCSVTVANYMIYVELEFCFRHGVPFKTELWDSIPSAYAKQMFALRFRKCVICGRDADLAHFETVGMGRNRFKIDESQFHYMALCRIHHTEQHTIGLTDFITKYHIKPIKLTPDQLHKIAPKYQIKGEDDGTAPNV
jgi:hypothetical protein